MGEVGRCKRRKEEQPQIRNQREALNLQIVNLISISY